MRGSAAAAQPVGVFTMMFAEALMRFLNVPAALMWHELCGSDTARQVVVQAQPGERLQLVVEVQG